MCLCCSLSPADILPLLKGVRGMALSDNGILSSSSSPPLGMRGHYIDTKQGHRRMSVVGSNQNKAITKRLASAGHYQQVCIITNCSLERHARGGSTNAREGILKECLVRAVLEVKSAWSLLSRVASDRLPISFSCHDARKCLDCCATLAGGARCLYVDLHACLQCGARGGLS